MDLKNKKVLITGGNSGIGKEIVKELIGRGVKDIAVIGRKKTSLENLKTEFENINFLTLQGDISKTEDLNRAVETLIKEWEQLDILINNAGVVSAGKLQDISDEDIANQININITGLILLTKKALPLLLKSKEGAIVNVSSGLGYVAMPFYSVYAATKAAVRYFSEAMRRELAGKPIHVMTIYPTATDTNMMKNADVNNMDSPEKVAKAAINGLINGEIDVILGGEEKKAQIALNFNHPEKIDEMARNNYESLKKRTKEHRSM
jgi:short-subunit dehydrogenase